MCALIILYIVPVFIHAYIITNFSIIMCTCCHIKWHYINLCTIYKLYIIQT